MKATANCNLFVIATVLVTVATMGFSQPPAFGQVVNSGQCTASTECTTPPSGYCDGNVSVSFGGSGTCNDSNADGTLDACQWTGLRTECSASERCYSGQCIDSLRPRLSAPPAQCADVEPTQSICDSSNDGGTLYYVVAGQSGCVIESETFICPESQECAVMGQISACVPAAPRLMADHRPTNVGAEDGLTQAQWTRVLRVHTRYAFRAEAGTCDELTSATDVMRCARVALCFATTNDEEATACWRTALGGGVR